MSKREEARANAITVPLTVDEREIIEKAAQKLGLTRSGFIRMVTLSEASKVLNN